jgi:hypothetical protein
MAAGTCAAACAGAHSEWKAGSERAGAAGTACGMGWAVRLGIPGLMLVLACGDSAAPAADAALADADPAAPDAAADAVVDARPGDVTVIALRDDGEPEPGTVVLVHGADGALVGRYTTSAVGAAVVAVPAGSMVSAIQYGEGRAVTTTVFGVQPQDELRFQAPPRVMPTQRRVEVAARYVEGATGYEVFSSCGGHDSSGAGLFWISAPGACLDGLAQFVSLATGADGVVRQTHTVVEGASSAVGFPDPYEPLGAMTLDIRGGGAIAVRAVLPASHDAALPVPGTTPDGPGLMTVSLAGAGSGVSLVVDSRHGNIAQRFAATPTEAAVVDLTVVPRIDSFRFEAGAFAWFVHGEPEVDGVVLRVIATRETQHTWRFVVPPGVQALTPPALPPDLDHVSPFHPDGKPGALVETFELSWVSGWDAFRQGGHIDAARVPEIVATKLDDARAVVGQLD